MKVDPTATGPMESGLFEQLVAVVEEVMQTSPVPGEAWAGEIVRKAKRGEATRTRDKSRTTSLFKRDSASSFGNSRIRLYLVCR